MPAPDRTATRRLPWPRLRRPERQRGHRDPVAARGLAAVSTYRLLLSVILILLALGVVMVLSASSVEAYDDTGNSFVVFKRQAVWVVLGLAVMLAAARIDYRAWRRVSVPLLLAAIVLLLWVVVAPSGRTVNGARSWIAVTGELRFQPSELAKLALLLFAADVLARKDKLLGDVRHALVPVLPVTMLLAGLIMLQPDLGTTLLVCAIGFGLLFVAGAPLGALALIGAGGLGAGFAMAMTAGYRRARLTSFLDPGADALGSGWQVIQGQLALGSGGLFGVGLGRSLQKWGHVPNAHTDFIFAIIGEELGLMGTLTVIALFSLFAYAGVRVAWTAPDRFGRYLAAGVTVWVTVTALVNLGAVVGALPITGVPLPLVSFGGSNLVVLLGGIGMLLNVAAQQQRALAARPLLAAIAPAAPAARRAPTRRPRTAAPARAATTSGGATVRTLRAAQPASRPTARKDTTDTAGLRPAAFRKETSDTAAGRRAVGADPPRGRRRPARSRRERNPR